MTPKTLFAVAFLAIVHFAAACTERSALPESAPAAAEPPAPAAEADAEDWSPEAVAIIERLAEQIRAGGRLCDELEIAQFGLYAPDYRERFGKLPAAEGMCETDDDDDLTFYVFAGNAEMEAFLEFKRELLCRRALEYDLPQFPGFPFVRGDVWFIQPDELATAQALAPILGAEAGMASCPGAILEEAVPAPAVAVPDAAPGEPPVIVVFAEAEPDWGTAPLTVQFSISDPYGHLIEPEIHWDFGDGNTSDLRSPRHTYEKPGEYTATLKVRDRGGEDEDEIDITVEEADD